MGDKKRCASGLNTHSAFDVKVTKWKQITKFKNVDCTVVEIYADDLIQMD